VYLCAYSDTTFHFVADPDPNPDPILQHNKDPHPVKIRILPDSARMYLYQIRDQRKYLPRLRKQTTHPDPHHFGNLDPYPDPHLRQGNKLDPDPHTGPHQRE
jgi:hypothetical protein